MVDTPGGDAVGSVCEQEKDLARLAFADADFLVLVFDAIQGLKRPSRNGRPIALPRDDGMSNIANKL